MVAAAVVAPGRKKAHATRANDDKGFLVGNAAVDKCALGGQSKDNSGNGSGGGDNDMFCCGMWSYVVCCVIGLVAV